MIGRRRAWARALPRTRIMRRPLLCTLILALAGACASPSPYPDLALGGGKADITDQVNLEGTLEFGGSVESSLVDDLQYDAYAFRARAGAVVRVETTHRGSSARLDDVLMVYGPGDDMTGYADATRIAENDDDGWGAHARIEGLTLEEEGSYLVIIGAKNGMDRGDYRIALSCESGECAPAVPDAASCDGEILGHAELCIEAAIYDDADSPEDAFDRCAGDHALEDHVVDRCEYSATPPAYCSAGVQTLIDTMLPDCQRQLGFELGLVAGPTNPARRAEIVSLAEATDVAGAHRLFDAAFDGSDGSRELRMSGLPSRVDGNSYAVIDAIDLAEVDPSWADVLSYEDEWEGWTEWHELEWERYRVIELWADGEVIGYVAESSATISYWHPSDPEDPVNAYFEAFVFMDGAGDIVTTIYGGP